MKEKPFNTHFPDAVSVTVTVLLDPPPHFIWQVDEVKTKAAVDAYKLAQKQKQQRKGKDKDKDKDKEIKRIEEELKKRKEEKKKKAVASAEEEEDDAVDEDGNVIEKSFPRLALGGDALEGEEEGSDDYGSSPVKSPLGTMIVIVIVTMSAEINQVFVNSLHAYVTLFRLFIGALFFSFSHILFFLSSHLILCHSLIPFSYAFLV